MTTDKETVFFISDAHLGIQLPDFADREAALLSFLEEIAPRAGQLFIVGDLFDFWIEYRWAIRPDYFRTLAALNALARSGTEIHYCLGNHDFAVGSFIEDTLGIKVHPDGCRMNLQGKSIFVTHGDDLRTSDRANLFLRKFLRNPILQFVYKLLHPNIGVPLGEFFSRMSRKHFLEVPPEEHLEEYRRAADEMLAAGCDIVVAAHTHVPELLHLTSGIYCNTGNWISRYHFAQMEAGEISLWQYLPGQPPKKIFPFQ